MSNEELEKIAKGEKDEYLLNRDIRAIFDAPYIIRKFIIEMGIKEGPDEIPNMIVYYHFKKLWLPERNREKPNNIEFCRTMHKFFPSGRKNSYRYFLLEKDTLDLSLHTRIAAYELKKEESYQKKSNKVSSTKQKL